MKFYSELTKKLYNTEADLTTDELAYSQKLAAQEEAEKKAREAREAALNERKARQKELADIVEEINSLKRKYRELADKYTNDYKALPTDTIREKPITSEKATTESSRSPITIFDLINELLGGACQHSDTETTDSEESK